MDGGFKTPWRAEHRFYRELQAKEKQAQRRTRASQPGSQGRSDAEKTKMCMNMIEDTERQRWGKIDQTPRLATGKRPDWNPEILTLRVSFLNHSFKFHGQIV